MAMLDLRHTWINLVATGDEVHCKTASRSESNESEGDVRTYASGRRRYFSKAGVKESMSFTLVDVTPDDLATLKDWKDDLVLVRDYKGRKMYGTYNSLSVTDSKTAAFHQVVMTVTEVTHAEGV